MRSAQTLILAFFTIAVTLFISVQTVAQKKQENDKLTLTVIGSGSPQFNPDRAGPAALITYKDTQIIVDTGNGTQARFNDLGLKIKSLDGILYTHHHLDHNEEFIPIFIRSLLGDNKFVLAGPPPMKAMNKSTLDQYKTDIEYRMRRSGRTLDDVLDNYQVKEINDKANFKIGEISISTAKVKHTIDTIAYRFDAGGESIVISGDLTYSESLTKLAKDTDVLLIESGGTIKVGGKKRNRTNSNNTKADKNTNRTGHIRAHVTLDETAKMAQESNAKKIVLTHFTNGENDEPATIAELRKTYKGEILFGVDLMTVTSNGSEIQAPIENKPRKQASSSQVNSYDPIAAERAKRKSDFTTRPTNPCLIEPSFDNKVSFVQEGHTRIIKANAIPNHKVGEFPTLNNPNRISEQNKTYTIPLAAEKATQLTYLYDQSIDYGRPNYIFGVALNGVKFEPTANEYFYGTQGHNYEWTVEALSDHVFLGDDCNNAHVQPNGEYHYHGTPTGLIAELDHNHSSPQSMLLAGWAADGFPVYYAFGYTSADNSNSSLKELKPSYQLRSGDRAGDGKTAPDGQYDGTYVRDYIYQENSGDLDQCNGREGVTPEFPNGTYYYVISKQFPFIGRCLVGLPSDDFKVGGGRRASQAQDSSTNQRKRRQGEQNSQNRPNPESIMNRMDSNQDQKISQNEAKGRLKDNFSQRDVNSDGFITVDELSPRRTN